MGKIIENIKKNYPIYLIIVIYFILHLLTIGKLGFTYSLNSDDLSYIISGITFRETGSITMHGVLSAQIMPGLTFFIAFMSLLFGKATLLWASLKIVYLIMAILIIYFTYKTIRLYTNKYISAIPCIFFLLPDFIWMNNIILTETPFILLFVLLIYHTLKLSMKTNIKDYICIVIYYILAVFIRPNIGIYPIFLFVFLLLKKYDFKLLIKQSLIAGAILITLLVPWTIRNYKVFNKFIPLTYGAGNPLLLGTYQGYNYPDDSTLDYKTNVYDEMDEEARYYIENPDVKSYMTKYYSLEYDGLVARYRMQKWWENDPTAMIKSYAIKKPYILITHSFYWEEIFGFKEAWVSKIHKCDILLTLISLLAIFIFKKYRKEVLFIGLVYISQVALYSYTFAFGRYGASMFFMRYIIFGIGIGVIYEVWRCKNESINDNSRLQRGKKHSKHSK